MFTCVYVCVVCFFSLCVHLGSLCCPSASLTSTGAISSLTSSVGTPSQKPYDRLAAFVSVFLFFIILFVFAVFETLGSPLSMDEFAWNKQETVLYNNIFYVGLAILAILTFIVVKIVSKR